MKHKPLRGGIGINIASLKNCVFYCLCHTTLLTPVICFCTEVFCCFFAKQVQVVVGRLVPSLEASFGRLKGPARSQLLQPQPEVKWLEVA